MKGATQTLVKNKMNKVVYEPSRQTPPFFHFPPTWYRPPDPGPGHTVPPLGYASLLAFHILPLFQHLVKFLANTMQFNTMGGKG